MIQARLVEGFCSEEIGRPLHCRAFNMTWEGHELLANISSNAVWNRIKEGARSKGVILSFDLVKFLAKKANLRHVYGVSSTSYANHNLIGTFHRGEEGIMQVPEEGR
jgi:Hypothetical protein (DUF2513)